MGGKIAVDVKNAERGTKVAVMGVLEGKNSDVVLLGPKKEIKKYIGNLVDIINTDEPIADGMDMLFDGDISAFITAGDTDRVVLRLYKSVKKYYKLDSILDKPIPIAARIPSRYYGKHSVVADLGALTGIGPVHLVDYAAMVDSYLRHCMQIPEPRIAILNIGTEPKKGNDLTRKAGELLRELSDKGLINFVGNKEPHDVWAYNADGFLCDGWTGNIFLKTAEAFAHAPSDLAKQELKNPINITLLTAGLGGVAGGLYDGVGGWIWTLLGCGAIGIANIYRDVRKKTDRSNYGGAIALGLEQVLIITHKSSKARVFATCVEQARGYLKQDIYNRTEERVLELRGAL